MALDTSELAKTPFYEMHVAAGARIVPFAGYAMPVQYQGIKVEHLHTRAKAGLFDVSHMGQLLISGEAAQRELEALVPVDLDTLDQDQMCLTFLTNDQGGILDDLIITKRSECEYFLVVNGACKEHDIRHIKAHLKESSLEHFENQALLALQGPEASAVLCGFLPELAEAIEGLTFMRGVGLQLEVDSGDFDIYISRSGYTGEDGFEISVPNQYAVLIAKALLEHSAVNWIGLGARDSLRLEAGLCLYGHDLNEETTPVEAGLVWSIDQSRRNGGAKAGGFPGAEIVLAQIENGVSRRRRGLVVKGKVPVREGAELIDEHGELVGRVTSGGVAPSFNGLIAMGYLSTEYLARDNASLSAIVRGKHQPVALHDLPFLKANYKRSRP